MDPLSLAIVAVLLFAVAFVFSNLGLGGGILFVPILLIFTDFPADVKVPIIMSTSLFFAMSNNIPSAYNHNKKGLVDVRTGLMVALAAIAGAIAGANFVIRSEASLVIGMFACLLIVIGVKAALEVASPRGQTDGRAGLSDVPSRLAAVALISVGTGFLSASFGIGGGVVTVEALIVVLGFSTRRAIGTSAFTIPIISLVGFSTYVYEGTPVQWELLALTPVVLVGGYIGSRWGLANLKTSTVRAIFTVVVFLAAAKLILEALGWP